MGPTTIYRIQVMPLWVCLVPAAAIATTFGIFGALSLRCNSLMLIMPFLIMGIGQSVNDSIHAYLEI